MTERRAIGTIRLFAWAAFIFLVTVIATSFVLTRLLPLTGHRTLVIDGRSMEPTLALGSAVVIAGVAPADLRVGDVVSLRTGPNQAVFTHRITRLATLDGRPFIETKGDANAEIDPSLTPASAVIGRVEWSFPALGFLISYLAIPSGMLFAALTGLTLLASLFLLDQLAVDAAAEGRSRRPPAGHAIQPADRRGAGAAGR